MEHVAEHRPLSYNKQPRRTRSSSAAGSANGELPSDGEASVSLGSESGSGLGSEGEWEWGSAPEAGEEQAWRGPATVHAGRPYRCSFEQGQNGCGAEGGAGQLGQEDPGCGEARRRKLERRRQQEREEREQRQRHQLPELHYVEVLFLASTCGGGAGGAGCLFGGCGCCCDGGGGMEAGGRRARAPRLADVAPNVSYLVVAAHDPTTCRCVVRLVSVR